MNSMKKKLSILLAIVIVLTSLIIPVSADTAGSTPDGAYINTGDMLYPVTKGDTYTYEYRLNLGKKLTAIDASLSYDTAGLELVNYTFPILGNSVNAGTYGGKLYFNYASATGIEFSGSSAVLIRATFKVKAENGTFDVHTDITDMARYQEVKIVENGTVISSFNHNELITDDDSKTSIYIKTGNKYYKVKRGKTYNYICYLKTDERVGNLVADTYYDSYWLYTSSSTRTSFQSYSGKYFAEDNTVLVSIPFTVSDYAYDNSIYSISTSISKLLDINDDTISRYTLTEVIDGLPYTMYNPNAPTEAPVPTEAPWYPTEVPIEPTTPDIPHDPSNYIYLNVDGSLYEVEAGSDHTYTFFLTDADTIYSIDAVTTWDAPYIEMVGNPRFPVFGDERGDIDDPYYAGNVVYNYFNNDKGEIDEVRFNWTKAEGVECSEKADVISFRIHIADDAPPGIYYITTKIKTLEGPYEEKQIFEGTDTIDPPIQRYGELDGTPGYKQFDYYTTYEQSYTRYSGKDEIFTIIGEKDYFHTVDKFRSLWIDLNADDTYRIEDGELVNYDSYTVNASENGAYITLAPTFLDTLLAGDYRLKFLFSDGDANSVLHILQESPTTPDEPIPIDPYDPNKIPYVGGNTINFYSPSAGWNEDDVVQFYVYEVSTGQGLIPWGSKKLNGSYVGNGVWSKDPSSMNLVPGKQYTIIFYDTYTGAYTYDLLFDTSCMGDTAYCTGNRLENPVDANKASLEAKWKYSSLGSRLQITSIGNVVGETCPSNTTPYKMLVGFLKDTLDNARVYSGKTDQQLLDNIASQLELSNDDVNRAITEAGIRVDWTPPYVPPTEPSADSYGYIPGEYYLTGSINGDNSGTAKAHKGLRFKEYSSDSMILEGVRLTQGDVVRVARYNGNNTFTIYPDGVGRDISITQSGRYDFYFKPYELGNGNYWYITPSYLGAIAPYLLGDADGNEDIEVRDATFIQRWLVKIDTPYTKAELMRGDVDDSGNLEIFDVTCIQYYLANMRTPFPIGTRIE